MDEQYSTSTALIYVFNVIVGTGALTLPKAFFQAGYILSTVLMIILALTSYITLTFVVEAMSSCNAIQQWTRLERLKRVRTLLREALQNDDSEDEGFPNISEEAVLLQEAEFIETFPSEPRKLYSLDNKIELGEMAHILFGTMGRIIFYTCLCLYLYGDLTIYSAAISKSLLDVTCNGSNINSFSDKCWDSDTYSYTRMTVYRLNLLIFFIGIGPYTLFDIQKMKYLQMFTTITRWFAFILMITLAVVRLSDESQEHGNPNYVVPTAFPALIGSSVYSFMCHHSLPSMLAPIADKRRLSIFLALDYGLILIFYLTLSITAVFAFPSLQDLYTLNFVPSSGLPIPKKIIDYFLTLFPAFTLMATFPILAITLRNNLQVIFQNTEIWYFHRIILPVMAVLPPILIASLTENIEFLVGITGSYAGVIIQYIIPATLVIFSRNAIPNAISHIPNDFKSPFKSRILPYVVLCWSVLCILLVSIDIIKNHFSP